MKIITATVTKQNLIITPSVLSVAESVNAYALKITYDAEWRDIDTKIVTFKGPCGRAYPIPDNGDENGVVIPWEVLRTPGKIHVGVIGYKGAEQKLTTTGIYERNTFVVLPAAFGLSEAITPTPDVYQKIVQTLEVMQGEIGDLRNLETETKENLVSAINEVAEATGAVGNVKSVNNKQPDQNGNVTLTPTDIGAATPASVASAVATEKAAREQADANLQTAINGKQATLSSAQLTAVNSGIDSTKVAQIATNANDITTIKGKIPTSASTTNQLADKNFVNSSVATNTANYISDNGEPFTSLADLEAYSGTLTNNDYAFVVGTDTAGNTTYTRYKYNATTQTWAEEYVLNNSSFTATQWSAINSGINSEGVAKLGGLADIKSVGANLSLNPSTGELSGIATVVEQTTGSSTTAVMSQKAVTDIIGNVETILQTLNSGTGAA